MARRRHTVARVVQYELHALPDNGLRGGSGAAPADRAAGPGRDRGRCGSRRFDVPDVRTAARAVLSLGIDVARWYSDRVTDSPAALGEQYAGLIVRMLGAH